jgi:hypothetical protein
MLLGFALVTTLFALKALWLILSGAYWIAATMAQASQEQTVHKGSGGSGMYAETRRDQLYHDDLGIRTDAWGDLGGWGGYD